MTGIFPPNHKPDWNTAYPITVHVVVSRLAPNDRVVIFVRRIQIFFGDHHFANRSITFLVIRSTTGSPPRSPCAQSVLPQVNTVPRRV